MVIRKYDILSAHIAYHITMFFAVEVDERMLVVEHDYFAEFATEQLKQRLFSISI